MGEIAQAFLLPETTMAQRITRAKKKIAAAKVPYRVPEAADLPERLASVLAVLFLVFSEGYLATGDGEPIRAELTGEAIRLTRVLSQLLPAEPEACGPGEPLRMQHVVLLGSGWVVLFSDRDTHGLSPG